MPEPDPIPIPVRVTCCYCRSGLEEEAATPEQADVVAVRLLTQALAEGWLDRPDGLYCPRCVAELFRLRLGGLADGLGR